MPAQSRFANPSSTQSQNTWLERLQPYVQQGAGMSRGKLSVATCHKNME